MARSSYYDEEQDQQPYDNSVYEDVYRQGLQSTGDPEQDPDASGPSAGTGGYPPLPSGDPGGPNPNAPGMPNAPVPPAPAPPPPASGSGAAGSGNGPDSINHGPPPGVSQAAWDAWLAQNPGDYYRGYHGALTNTPTGSGGGGGGGGGLGNANLNALYKLLLDRITGPTGPQSSPLRDQVLAQLQAMITEGGKPIGDVSASPEALAYRTALDRGTADTRSALAERRTAQGLGGSNMDTDILGLKQEQAYAQSQYEAKLSHDLLLDKKDRLERAMSMGAGIISDEQRLQVQQQLSSVNSALAMFTALLGNQFNYDQLGYWLAAQEGNANASAANPGG